MTLIYEDMVSVFPHRKGAYEPSFMFKTVTILPHVPQPKGIFVPLFPHSENLQQAIGNGAVGAIWDSETPLPAFTPNSFMIFYTNDVWKGLENMLELYNKKLTTYEQAENTKFILFEKDILNNQEGTYDISEVMRSLKTRFKISNEREGE